MKLTEETPGVVQSTEESGISMVMSFLKEMFQPELMAGWASAAGTFAAAFVALWLARDARKIKIKGYFNVVNIMPSKKDLPPGKYLYISAINTGVRPATVTGLSFRCGRRLFRRWRKNEKSVWLGAKACVSGSDTLPVTTSPNEETKWVFPIERIMNKFVGYLLETEKDAKSLQCVISTTRNDTIALARNKHITKWFIDFIRNKHENPPTR